MRVSDELIEAAAHLSNKVDKMTFSEPVACVYNPLRYAWRPHETYIQRYGNTHKRIVFLGMNPGPWGMAQVGVPFGEVAFVRDWLKIDEPVDTPNPEHPKRPILGFSCEKSEVSGRRLWGLFASRYSNAEIFFESHFVLNYCPLVFMEESGRNRTPDKLPTKESEPLFAACDEYLRHCIASLKPEWIVGVGGFAQQRARIALPQSGLRHGKVLHPSPASPAANRGWSEAATRQLIEQGIW